MFSLLSLCTRLLWMDFRAWITALITPDTLRTASEKIGLSHSTVTRQLSRETLTPTTVIALCRAYGRSPVDGLVQTGYLHAAETEGVGISAALDIATNHQLLDEVLRRSDPDSRYLFGRSADVINPDLTSATSPVVDDTADSDGSDGSDDTEGTVADWRSHGHAADDSQDEDQGREDAGSEPFN